MHGLALHTRPRFHFLLGQLGLSLKHFLPIKWLMAGAYDEDLHENPFFKTLVERHRQLFARAEEGRWTVS